MENSPKKRPGSKRSTSPPTRSVPPAIRLGPESLKNGVVQHMLRLGVPVNRENYLELAGLQEPLDPEVEADLPGGAPAAATLSARALRLAAEKSEQGFFDPDLFRAAPRISAGSIYEKGMEFVDSATITNNVGRRR